jgi:hypothetical protein
VTQREQDDRAAAVSLSMEVMTDLRAVEIKARAVLAVVAGDSDTFQGPLVKAAAELAVGVSHQMEVALNVANRVKHYVETAGMTDADLDDLARRHRGELRDLPEAL